MGWILSQIPCSKYYTAQVVLLSPPNQCPSRALTRHFEAYVYWVYLITRSWAVSWSKRQEFENWGTYVHLGHIFTVMDVFALIPVILVLVVKILCLHAVHVWSIKTQIRVPSKHRSNCGRRIFKGWKNFNQLCRQHTANRCNWNSVRIIGNCMIRIKMRCDCL